MFKNKFKFSSKKKKNLVKYKKINTDLPKTRPRHYGIDLARILAIIFIINHHIIYHGGPLFGSSKFSKEFNFLIFFNLICCSGVDIFGMISGFVGFHSHKYSNLLYILIMTSFYSYGIAYFLKHYWLRLRINNIKNFIYPIFITDYWYVTAYFCMYFLLPIINIGILYIKKEDMKYFLIILFLIFSCLGEIKNYSKLFNKDLYHFSNGFSFIWLIILYLYGSYFGKFKKVVEKYKFFYYIIYLLLIILFPLIRTKIILYKYKKYNILNMNVDYTAPSSVIIAIIFINIFSDFNAKNKYIVKIISFFAPLTFGVYLLHNHVLVRNNIINKYFIYILKYKSFKLILVEIYCSIKVFLICSIIDYARYILFKLLKIRELCILIEKFINFIGSKIIF